MPVKCRIILREMVRHIYNNSVAHVGLNQGTRKFSINEEHGTDNTYHLLAKDPASSINICLGLIRTVRPPNPFRDGKVVIPSRWRGIQIPSRI